MARMATGRSSTGGFHVPPPPALGEEERGELVRLVLASLSTFVDRGDPPSTELRGVLGERHGVFVTLYSGNRLRGCMGTVLPVRSLAENAVEFARAAASRDPRFPPVTRDEVDGLDVEISILGSVMVYDDASEGLLEHFETGVHGLYLVRDRRRRGLLLPKVASQLGLSAEEFFRRVAEKAGLGPDGWALPEVSLGLFTAADFPASRP